MPIVASDIKRRLSGGAANSDPNASIGGVKSTTEMAAASDNNLFDDVSGAESQAGDIEYRCLYYHNGHATLTAQNFAVYIQSNTPAAGSDVSIGLDPAGIGDGSATGVATTPADEDSAPAGVSFSQPSSGSPLSVGNLAPGQSIAVWIRRTISAAAAAHNADQVDIGWTLDTAA